MQAQDEQLLQSVRHALQQEYKFQQIVQQAKVSHPVLAITVGHGLQCSSWCGVVQAHATASEQSVAELETCILEHLVSSSSCSSLVFQPLLVEAHDLTWSYIFLCRLPRGMQRTYATLHLQPKHSCSTLTVLFQRQVKQPACLSA